jgi:hypothetical protein
MRRREFITLASWPISPRPIDLAAHGGTPWIKARDQPDPHWIGTAHEDDGDGRGRSLRCIKGAWTGGDHSHSTLDKVGGQLGQSIVLILPPAVFDRQILALDKTSFAQPLAECGISMGGRGRRPGVEKTDHRYGRLLRPRRERPHRHCAAEQGDELAAPHCPMPPVLPTQG